MNDSLSNGRFLILGIRPHEGSACLRKLEGDRLYPFVKGFTVDDDGISFNRNEAIDHIYDEYFRTNNDESLHVSVSAIVGENGSGKSSIIEFMMRLINNLSAYILGEEVRIGTNRTRFIRNIIEKDSHNNRIVKQIKGDLYYLLNDTIYVLSIDGNKVQLISYEKEGDKYHLNNENLLPSNSMIELEGKGTNGNIQLFKEADYKDINRINHLLFYSQIFNYSIYAYNTLDFSEEGTDYNTEKIIQEKAGNDIKNFGIEDCNWLNGVLNRHDGYKNPLAIYPFRELGNFDINIENELAIERIHGLRARIPDSFTDVNSHLSIHDFEFPDEFIDNKTGNPIPIEKLYDYSFFNIKRGYDFTLQEFESFTKNVIDEWEKKLKTKKGKIICPSTFEEKYKIRKKVAERYIFYKTIKIATQYQIYKKNNYKIFSNKQIDLSQLRNLIEYIMNDLSSRTSKLRHALAFYFVGVPYMNKDDLKDTKKLVKNMINGTSILETDIVPPPFLQPQILLKDKLRDDSELINFKLISSGERQQIYFVSSVLYHLYNLDINFEIRKNSNWLNYQNVNLVFEEIELYFHPNFQKQLISRLFEGIKRLNLKYIRYINIVFVTHSPFILSDIPKENILQCTSDYEEIHNSDRFGTFGANIYDILKCNFLKDGVIGDFAKWTINRIVSILKIQEYIKKNNAYSKGSIIRIPLNILSGTKDASTDGIRGLKKETNGIIIEDYNTFYSYYKEWLKREIDVIDAPIIRKSLLAEYYDIFATDEDIVARIRELKEELKILEKKE